MSDEGKGYYWPGSFRNSSGCNCNRVYGSPPGPQLFAARWRHGWVGSGCRLRSHELAPDPQRVGRPLRTGSGHRHRRTPAGCYSFISQTEGISNVDLVVDDLFDSNLEPRSFNLVHARFLIAPLGHGREQVAAHRRLLKPGGWLVLEEWDTSSWHFNPPAPAAERLIRLMYEIFATRGGEAGRELPALFREIGIADPGIDAHVIALKPGHPYLRLPLQFSVSLERLLLQSVSADELASLRRAAEAELANPGKVGERRSPWSRVGARSKAAVETRLSWQPDLHSAL